MYTSVLVNLLFKNGQTRIFVVHPKESIDQQDAEVFVDLFNGEITDDKGRQEKITDFRLEIRPGSFVFLKIDEIAFADFTFNKDEE